MTTNCMATFIREANGGYEYRSYPAMWQGKGGFTAVNKHGEKSTAKAIIYVPDISADIATGDYAVKGNYSANAEELINSALRITGVSKHDYGSRNMQHVRAEAE